MRPEYVELHAHSNFSFQEGASHPRELLRQAKHLGYRALALTDHDNLTAVLDFAAKAAPLDLQPIVGCEVTLEGGYHLTLLAPTQEAYGKLCALLSHAYVEGEDRKEPRVSRDMLAEHAAGLIALTGCRTGEVPSLAAEGRMDDATAALRRYLDWFGSGNVYLEMQQNLVHGDTPRNRRLAELGRRLSVPLVATNNAHYHVPERHRLHDVLVAVKHLKSLEESHRERRANAEFYLKSPQQMARLFQEVPDALRNTLAIADRCADFDLRNPRHLGYRFPDYPVPDGFTEDTYLRRICEEAAHRKYGGIPQRVRERLEDELARIRKHALSGYFLIYYDIVRLARQVMIDLGVGDPEVPLEDNPPGRGRGSSVAMLVGYLIGLSHIDPLEFDLFGLDRFLPYEGEITALDIDLDFPRNIREELILRVFDKYTWKQAALVGAISTYRVRGVVRSLGRALSLPPDQVDRLTKQLSHRTGPDLRLEMSGLSGFKHLVDAPGWRDLLELAPQLARFPRLVQQHSGGMVVSSSPLIEVVPVMRAAIEGRYVMQWDKDAVDQANMVKIDFLALGALSQLQEATRLVRQRGGEPLDITRIDYADQAVYDDLIRTDTVGIFQVESAAQMQTLPRLKPRNLHDMAYEVAAVRPGVGANDGVAEFIRRYRRGVKWDYDHPLEAKALERTKGIILYQDQVNELAVHVAGFSPRNADMMRRAFGKGDRDAVMDWWERFRAGAVERGVDESTALRIWEKFNGQYMFPEAHAYAFGITAYQMSWLKHHHPLEFFTGLYNEQPMGFWSPDTIKEDAKRHGIRILRPDINRSQEKTIIEEESIRLGFSYVQNMGPAQIFRLARDRERGGPFGAVADTVERARLSQAALESLAEAGAFDTFNPDRRAVKWEIGLLYQARDTHQLQLRLPTGQDMAVLPEQTRAELLSGEYKSMGLAPSGHAMEELRASLPADAVPSNWLDDYQDGAMITVAGRVIRRQMPGGKSVFITLEDEHGFIPLIVWPDTWNAQKEALRSHYLIVRGTVSRRDGTLNVIVKTGRPLPELPHATGAREWH